MGAFIKKKMGAVRRTKWVLLKERKSVLKEKEKQIG